jgi:hypothetical protein
MPGESILDSYVKSIPSAQNAVDILKGEWSSKLPPPFDSVTTAGVIPLFQDARIAWLNHMLGGVLGYNILELGPLEGGHSYMMEQAGVGSNTAIESNSRAYLKCLIVKEILNLTRTRFLCGDFVPYLESSKQHFDLILASGVLYHMKDPLHVLELIADHTDRVYLWTHYFDHKLIAARKGFIAKFREPEIVKIQGTPIAVHRHDYLAQLDEITYCGGGEEYSKWLTRDGLIQTLKLFGFNHLEFSFEMPTHHNGPALSILATKK